MLLLGYGRHQGPGRRTPHDRLRGPFLLAARHRPPSLPKTDVALFRRVVRSRFFATVSERLLRAHTATGSLFGSERASSPTLPPVRNFCVTDASHPDNPIVCANSGFLSLFGYDALDEVLGRSCKFLQGPVTHPRAIELIRASMEEGSDLSVCIANYRNDGTVFWNHFFMTALRDAGGSICFFVGVQREVSEEVASSLITY